VERHEKERILADLERGREVLLDALAGVTEDTAAVSPAQGKWSVLECVEHLALSEEYLFGQIEVSHASEAPTGNEKREALIVARGLDRTRAVESPDVGRPAARFSTLAAAVQSFLAARERTIRFVERCGKTFAPSQRGIRLSER
jgi:DinB superfamily